MTRPEMIGLSLRWTLVNHTKLEKKLTPSLHPNANAVRPEDFDIYDMVILNIHCNYY